ncbi:MAG: AtpZ/AtpI family protein [Bdellovibrionales bacterium]
MNSGYGFLGIVILCGLIGFGVDKAFDTLPWGLMGCLILGFVGATIRAQRIMNKKD